VVNGVCKEGYFKSSRFFPYTFIVPFYVIGIVVAVRDKVEKMAKLVLLLAKKKVLLSR
jgi:hypothetical protein